MNTYADGLSRAFEVDIPWLWTYFVTIFSVSRVYVDRLIADNISRCI